MGWISRRRTSTPRPNAWRHEAGISVDIRELGSNQRIELEKQFNRLAFVISCVISPDKTRMRLMIIDTVLTRDRRERLEQAYTAATGRPLVIETALSAPASGHARSKQRRGVRSDDVSDGFWLGAWFGSIFGPGAGDGD